MQSNFAEKDPKLTTATLLSAFNMPPDEAIKYLKGKGIEVDFDWKTAKAEAKAKAFAITGQNNINVLAKFKDKMEQALKEGQSFSDFKKSLTADGIQSIPRMKVIFQTNIQTAYMAGRYREQISNVKRNPYWRFRAVLDNSTTTICTGLNNKVFKYDNPIWDKFYPPNHFGCRSRVEVLNDSDLKELGLKLSNDLPDRVDLPSNGFDYNPGMAFYNPNYSAIPKELKAEAEQLNSIGSIHNVKGERVPSAQTFSALNKISTQIFDDYESGIKSIGDTLKIKDLKTSEELQWGTRKKEPDSNYGWSGDIEFRISNHELPNRGFKEKTKFLDGKAEVFYVNDNIEIILKQEIKSEYLELEEQIKTATGGKKATISRKMDKIRIVGLETGGQYTGRWYVDKVKYNINSTARQDDLAKNYREVKVSNGL